MDLDNYSDSESDSLDSGSDRDIVDYILETEGGFNSGLLEETLNVSDENLESEGVLQAIESKTLSNYVSVIKTRSPKLPRSVRTLVMGLIGQANMNFVRGDYPETLRLCKEAIRLAPHTSEAYQTMSEIYDEIGEYDTALQLGMMAAATGSKDADRWLSLGDKALDLDKIQDAIFCYNRALRCNHELYEVYLNIIKLYDPKKEKRQIILTYQSLVKHAPLHLKEKILEYAQNAAKILHDDDVDGALKIMELAFERVPESVTYEHVNLIVELYLQLHKFEESLQVISRHCDVTIEGEKDIVDGESTEECTSPLRVTNCVINSELPSEIRAKLAIILINLKAYHLTDYVIGPLLTVVEEFGDLFLDIIDAFMVDSHYDEAIKLLQLLVNSERYNVPQVWWSYAECLKNVGRKEEAVNLYLLIVEKAPQYVDARLILSDLLNELGRGDEALTALQQDPKSQCIDISILYERCLLLKNKPDKVNEFLAVGKLLLSRHCATFRNKKEFSKFILCANGRSKQDMMKTMQQNDTEDHIFVEGNRMPTPEEEYDLFLALCKAAFDTKNYPLFQRISCSAMSSKVICNTPQQILEIQLLGALAAFLNKDINACHAFFKYLVANDYDNHKTWNLFNTMLTQAESGQQKYVIRLLAHKPCHFALPQIFANNCFNNGIYKQALSEYLLQYKHKPTPLLALMIAITCLHIAIQSHAKGVSALVAQSMGFMSQYKELRGPACLQEVQYNLGRLNHQLGLLPPALHHYKQVLEISAPFELYDLKREAAFNISLIYQKSQSFDLARYYIEKYIVI